MDNGPTHDNNLKQAWNEGRCYSSVPRPCQDFNHICTGTGPHLWRAVAASRLGL